MQTVNTVRALDKSYSFLGQVGAIMTSSLLFAVLLGLMSVKAVKSETATPTIESQWASGFKMNMQLQLLDEVTSGWTMTLRFTKPAPGLQIWRAKIVLVSSDKKVYKLENMPWNPILKRCSILEIDFLADKMEYGKAAPGASVEFRRNGGSNSTLDEAACSTTTSAPTTTAPQPMTTTSPPTTGTKPTIQTSTRKPFTLGPLVAEQTTNATIVDDWNLGFKMLFTFLIKQAVNEGWIVKISFTKPAHNLQIWRAQLVSVSSDRKTFIVRNMSYNKVLAKCTVLEIDFMADKGVAGDAAPQAEITFYRNGAPVPTSDNTICATTTTSPSTASPITRPTTKPTTHTTSTASPSSSSQPTTHQTTMSPPTTAQRETTTSKPTTNPATNKPTTSTATTSPSLYDYNKVLHASILFYEAQRSGKLPATNRIPWRGDSALSDRGDNGEDLTGGWYDAGDFVKFGFPMASSVTVLAWGLVEYRDAYKAAGELDNALDSIKWVTDYFIKAHTAKFEFYGQVSKIRTCMHFGKLHAKPLKTSISIKAATACDL